MIHSFINGRNIRLLRFGSQTNIVDHLSGGNRHNKISRACHALSTIMFVGTVKAFSIIDNEIDYVCF